MKKGGYQIVDLKGKDFALGEGLVFDGIYECIEGTNKVKLISGLTVAGTEYDDCFVNFTVSGSDFVGEIYGYTITVADSDTVIIATKE